MLRRTLVTLLFALVLLLVALPVLVGGQVLLRAAGDEPASSVLRWVSGTVLLLVVIDLILLVGVLAVRALLDMGETGGAENPRDDA